MKKIYTLTLILFSFNCFSQITSVANGNFYFPTTWSCSCVPTNGTEDLIINHTVTLNNNLQLLTGGSITINSNGSLIQDIPSRGFLLNGGDFSNSGLFTIDQMLAQSGTFVNNGSAEIRTFSNFLLTFNNSGTISNCDSLYNDGEINNLGTIDVGTFYNDSILNNSGNLPAVDSLTNAGTFNNNAFSHLTVNRMTNTGTFVNDGVINDTAFFNLGNFTNNLIVNFTWITNAGDFENNNNMFGISSLWNIENFTNQITGNLYLGGNFYNGDTVNSNASFTNNGLVSSLNWFNTDLVVGSDSGAFFVQDSSANIGTMDGSFDFCDQTPTAIVPPFLDYNSGTVNNNITWCLTVSQSEPIAERLSVYPSPANDILTLISPANINSDVAIFDSHGKEVYSFSLSNSNSMIDISSMPNGIYFIRIVNNGNFYSKSFVISR